MKGSQFEKWRNEQEKEGIEQGYYYSNKVGWKAALEYVREEILNSDSCWDYNPKNIVRFINKELESD